MADLAVASSLAVIYSTSLLYAGFIGLGVLWASAAVGYGGNGGGGKHGHQGGYGNRYRGGYGGGYGGGYRGGHASYHHRGYRSYGRSDGRFEPPDIKPIKPIFVKKTLPGSNVDLKKTLADDHTLKANGGLTEKQHKQQTSSREGLKLGIMGTIGDRQRSRFSATNSGSAEIPTTSTLSKRIRRDTDEDWRPYFHESEDVAPRLNPQMTHQPVSSHYKGRANPEGFHKGRPEGLRVGRPEGFGGLSYVEREEERLLRAIRDSDKMNCGLRLVCELAAIRNRPLKREEWEILRFVRHGDGLFNLMFPGHGVEPESLALHDYKEAVRYGERGGACAQLFRKCRVGADQIMTFVARLLR